MMSKKTEIKLTAIALKKKNNRSITHITQINNKKKNTITYYL